MLTRALRNREPVGASACWACARCGRALGGGHA
jgi:hypothetical protein